MASILGANESWDVALKNKSVFHPPLLVFYPLFGLNMWYLNVQIRFSINSAHKIGGKKPVRVVKNFCISKYEHSGFFCAKNHSKNHYHILKTRENSHQWSATILKQWKKYFWKSDFWKFEIFKLFLASKWWNLIDGYFHEFLI